MNFEEYLSSKKIDGQAFFMAEPELFTSWKSQFDQMHPNSFTIQKLNLINPIRRKYQIKEVAVQPSEKPIVSSQSSAKPGKPVIKPKFN